jgi:hypothetical protein
MKTEFELDTKGVGTYTGKIKLIGLPPKYLPYVSVSMKSTNGVELSACIRDKDLERFAVNILKALKSKHLKK